MPPRKITIARKNKLSFTEGTFFEQYGSGLYMLAQVDRGVHKLISVPGGNRYAEEPTTDAYLRANGFSKIEVNVEVN